MTTEYDIYTNLRYEIAQDLSPGQFEEAKTSLLKIRLLEDAGWISTVPCMECERRERDEQDAQSI